ncbi:MAG: hypothetical protein SVS15_04835 [Thermodesulfobacteriota bacterium]|nr:hypothetical protein [Thermodesulfobacteriota bacterium]
MKKYISIFILAVVFQFCFPYPSHPEEFNLRKTRWGMSRQEVIDSEQGKSPHEKDNRISYKVKVLGKDFLLLYFFAQNKLVRAVYFLDVEHSNKNDFIYEYEEIKEVLTEKYGRPIKDKTLWANYLYKNDRSHWGLAISLGHVHFYSTWKKEDTRITNYLSGENSDIHCFVEYASIKLIHLEEQQQHKKNMEAF